MVRTFMGKGQKRGGSLHGLRNYRDLSKSSASLPIVYATITVKYIDDTLLYVSSLQRTHCLTILTILQPIVHISILLMVSFIWV